MTVYQFISRCPGLIQKGGYIYPYGEKQQSKKEICTVINV